MKVDLIGYRTGKLTVIEHVGKNKRGKNIWKCQCDCGNETIADTTTIKNNKIKSCGCSRIPEMIGQKYGKLTVIKRVENIDNRVRYKCQCECGNTTIADGKNLRRGYTTSCGCYIKELSSVMAHKLQEDNFIDLTKKTFGSLEVLEYIGISDKTKQRLWKCKCECGSEIIVTANSLRTGNTQSCGCIYSRGEHKISKILSENNILFEREKSFNECKLSSGRKARFDFYVNNHYVIEYDGKQHFQAEGTGWNTEEKYKFTKKSDMIKNKYCFNNNIPIIRIPYWHFDNLCLEDLLLETSKFLL